jgi:hypothetical protein
MKLSDDDFRIVFWAALIPAYLAIIVLLLAVKEFPSNDCGRQRSLSFHGSDIKSLSAAFWWVIAIASVLSLARYSQAFLVLKAYDIGLDAALVPMALVVAYLAYSLSAYPFGILADRINRALSTGVRRAGSDRSQSDIAWCEHSLVCSGWCRVVGFAIGNNAGITWGCCR